MKRGAFARPLRDDAHLDCKRVLIATPHYCQVLAYVLGGIGVELHYDGSTANGDARYLLDPPVTVEMLRPVMDDLTALGAEWSLF